MRAMRAFGTSFRGYQNSLSSHDSAPPPSPPVFVEAGRRLPVDRSAFGRRHSPTEGLQHQSRRRLVGHQAESERRGDHLYIQFKWAPRWDE